MQVVVVLIHYRALFVWSFLLLILVLGKMERGFSMALGTQVEFSSLK